MNILVTGGAGYIGATVAHELRKLGHEVVIYDCLAYGEQQRQRVVDFPLVVGLTQDKELVRKTLCDYKIEAVMHFAAWIEAGESMKDPGKFFENNFYGTLQVLRAMVEENVKKFIFSSTAAVYGIPKVVPILESSEHKPVNAYGESKYMVEKALRWFDQIHGVKFMVLRYFNAAGAFIDGSLGEDHIPETHLIPNVLKSAQTGEPIFLFGDDYNTPDGTCIRDYIHVLDLAQAHILLLHALEKGDPSNFYNCGTGKGFSNKQIIEMVKEVTGKNFPVHVAARRSGDPDQLIADSSRLQKDYNWQPKYSDLKTIINSAWEWQIRKS